MPSDAKTTEPVETEALAMLVELGLEQHEGKTNA